LFEKLNANFQNFFLVVHSFIRIRICRLISASHRANKKSVKAREVKFCGYQEVQGVIRPEICTRKFERDL